MLERPAAAKRLRRARQRRWRQRERAGRIVIPVEIDCEVIELLRRLHWLPESAAGDRRAIGNAIEAMLKDSAKRIT